MRRLARGLLGGFALLAALVLGLWVATRGDYTVPALVTDDPALPAVDLAGHRLHLQIIDGPPGAQTIVVLHGGPGGDFRALLALADLSDSYRVLFYDQRGAGLSERAADEALTLDGYLAELDAVIDHVAPDRPVTLIGHSWGAMLAVAYLNRAPDRVTRTVLIEPGYLDAAGRDRWQAQSRAFMSGPAWWAAAVTNGFRASHLSAANPEARADFVTGRMVHRFADHPANSYHCGTGYTAPSWRFGARANTVWANAPATEIDRIDDGVTAFDGPVLLLAGACDDWLGAPLQTLHTARFRNAGLTVIPDAGHDVIWDNPAAALAAIRNFLAADPG